MLPGLSTYVCRLQWEAKVADLIKRVQEYLEKKYGETQPDMLCRIYIRRIEHLYYKVGVVFSGFIVCVKMVST